MNFRVCDVFLTMFREQITVDLPHGCRCISACQRSKSREHSSSGDTVHALKANLGSGTVENILSDVATVRMRMICVTFRNVFTTQVDPFSDAQPTPDRLKIAIFIIGIIFESPRWARNFLESAVK
jgi:hypothetical protein